MDIPSRSELQQLRFDAIMRDDKIMRGMSIGLNGCAINMFQILTRKHNFTAEESLGFISQELMEAQANIADFVFD